jgi:predicted metal-dependent phosphotriesterase family hydrolase
VVQVFKAVADKVASTGAPLATHTDVPTFAQLRALARMLAGVQSILEEAQRASAFRVLGR